MEPRNSLVDINSPVSLRKVNIILSKMALRLVLVVNIFFPKGFQVSYDLIMHGRNILERFPMSSFSLENDQKKKEYTKLY